MSLLMVCDFIFYYSYTLLSMVINFLVVFLIKKTSWGGLLSKLINLYFKFLSFHLYFLIH